LIGPSTLKDAITRLTIFIKNSTDDLTLFELVGSDWVKRTPQPIKISLEQDGQDTPDIFLAYPLQALGLYRLIKGDFKPEKFPYFMRPNPKNEFPVWGAIFEGLWHWLLAGSVLFIGFAISRITHRLEQKREN
jgi:hypothetical protein